MLNKSDYSVFFSPGSTNPASELIFGASHFFSRFKVATGWMQSHNKILTNPRGGSVILGQIPIDSFNAELLGALSPAGLVVSCNDYFELAGCGTVSAVTPPSLWSQAGIKHHHLPFTDFSDNANPVLVIETLEKMWSTYNAGHSVYVHCKAGRARSAMLVALFMFYAELKTSNLNIAADSADLEQLFREKIDILVEKRPEVHLDERKIALGVRILRQLVERFGNENIGRESIAQDEPFIQSGPFFAKLSQAPEFKALWHFGYNNSSIFGDMQILMSALYDDPLTVLAALGSPARASNADLLEACQNIAASDTGAALLDRLRVFLFNNKDGDYQPQLSPLNLAYRKFNRSLELYKGDAHIFKAARKLQSAILLSIAPDEDKERWLGLTVQFLDDPLTWAKHYYQEAENAIISDDPSARRLGKAIIIIAATVLMSAFFAGIVAGSIFTVPVVSVIAVACLAFMALGLLVMKGAVDDSVTERSRKLIREVELLQEVERIYTPYR